MGWQQTVQIKYVALGIGERRAFVQQRIVQKLVAAERGFDDSRQWAVICVGACVVSLMNALDLQYTMSKKSKASSVHPRNWLQPHVLFAGPAGKCRDAHCFVSLAAVALSDSRT